MWIMENDPEVLELTFSVDEEVFGVVSCRFDDVLDLDIQCKARGVCFDL